MRYKPLISVIIIFLDGEQFLKEAIASVFTQTYEHWELLLVDDGSTDDSTAIAQRYAQQHPDKIRYLEHEGHQNRGMSASRNLGIRHAKGEFVGFLDADDIWLPQKLEEQIGILKKYPEAAMVYGRTQIWHSWAGSLNNQNSDYFYDLGVKPNTLVYPPELFLELLRNKSQTPTTCNALFRRSVFNTVGYFEEQFRTLYEDQVFFSKLLIHYPTFVSDACWAKYRQHAESCSAGRKTENYYIQRRSFLTWLGSYLSQRNIKDRDVLRMWQWEKLKCDYPSVAIGVEWFFRFLSKVKVLSRSYSDYWLQRTKIRIDNIK